MTEHDPTSPPVIDLDDIEALLAALTPSEETSTSAIIREERRRRQAMDDHRLVKGENPAPPLSAEIIEQLLGESAALADGGDFTSAQKLASIAGQIARAAKAASELSSPRIAESLVHFDLQNENRATIRVSASAAKVSFSKILMHAMNGDTVLIEKFGKPVARLAPIENDKTTWREES